MRVENASWPDVSFPKQLYTLPKLEALEVLTIVSVLPVLLQGVGDKSFNTKLIAQHLQLLGTFLSCLVDQHPPLLLDPLACVDLVAGLLPKTLDPVQLPPHLSQ